MLAVCVAPLAQRPRSEKGWHGPRLARESIGCTDPGLSPKRHAGSTGEFEEAPLALVRGQECFLSLLSEQWQPASSLQALCIRAYIYSTGGQSCASYIALPSLRPLPSKCVIRSFAQRADASPPATVTPTPGLSDAASALSPLPASVDFQVRIRFRVSCSAARVLWSTINH